MLRFYAHQWEWEGNGSEAEGKREQGRLAVRSCANKKRRKSVNCDESRSTSQEGGSEKNVEIRISRRRA